METQNQFNMRRFWIRKALLIPFIIAGAVLLFGGVVMLLWNAILPGVVGVSTITFWQALGILLLAKILFGGFRGGWGGRARRGMYWKQKWMSMSEAERAKFKEEWTKRCGRGAWRMKEEQQGGSGTEQA